MPQFELGSALVLQAEFQRLTPFGSTAYFDPSPAPKISIYNPLGELVVTDASMTNSTVGKWYYLCQTLTTWLPGTYATKVTAIDGSYSDVAKDAAAFELT